MCGASINTRTILGTINKYGQAPQLTHVHFPRVFTLPGTLIIGVTGLFVAYLCFAYLRLLTM